MRKEIRLAAVLAVLVLLVACGGKKASSLTEPAPDPNAALHGTWEGQLTVNWPFGSEQYGITLVITGVGPDETVAGGTVVFYLESGQFAMGDGTLSDPDVTLVVLGVFQDSPGHLIDLNLAGKRDGAQIMGSAAVPDAHATGSFAVAKV